MSIPAVAQSSVVRLDPMLAVASKANCPTNTMPDHRIFVAMVTEVTASEVHSTICRQTIYLWTVYLYQCYHRNQSSIWQSYAVSSLSPSFCFYSVCMVLIRI